MRSDMPRYIWERRWANRPDAWVLDTHDNGHTVRDPIAMCDDLLMAERICRLLNDEETLKAERRKFAAELSAAVACVDRLFA